MSTIYQLERRLKIKKKAHHRAAALEQNSQKKGNVKKGRIVTPRKPNSARRSAVKIFLCNDIQIVAYIPGSGHNLRPHSSVLVRGGGARDLPGVRYSCIRGVYDFMSLSDKKRRRSIYGAKKILLDNEVKKLRRKFRFR